MSDQMQGIKRRIKSIASTERITSAMKLVSASKLRKSKAVYESSKIYLHRLLQDLDENFQHTDEVPYEFLAGSRKVKTKCYVVITSSNGLCGNFNANVIREAADRLSEFQGDDRKVKLITIGSKGREYFGRRGVEILRENDAPADTVTFQDSSDISGPLIEMYRKGEIDEIDIIYTSYINTLKQEVMVKRLLPIEIGEIKNEKAVSVKPEYEPSPEKVFEYLILKYIELFIYSTCIESATCEYAARRTAMESSNDSARDMLASLETEYNRARQAVITDEIIEIVAGSEAQR